MASLGKYDTKLSPEEEVRFREWAKSTGRENDTEDYDLRGSYKAGIRPPKGEHLPDTYKKPNHPTFSNESKYSDGDAGEWVKGPKKDSWIFKAGPANLKSHSPDELQQYFRKVEPSNTLQLPQNEPVDRQLIDSVRRSVDMSKEPAPAPKTPAAPPKQQTGLGLEHMSFLDGLMFALTGTPKDMQAPQDQAQSQKKSSEAGNTSAAFANSGGDAADAYMGAPGAKGGGINLSDIIKFVGMVV